jgi:hypothetical protein
MPGFDGTGPMGMGAMTGGGRGYCASPAGRPVYGFPAGRFFGRGGGRGRRNMYYATGMTGWQRAGYPYAAGNMTPEEEKNVLKGEEEALKRELENIQKRMSEL